MQGDGDREADSVIVIEPFDPARHERSGFSCGTERLDNFLRFSARKQQKDDFTRVFVAVAEGSPRILGYYALNAHAVATGDLGADRPKRAPNTGSIPALYLSMIAVDRSRQGKGLGSDLAIDALARARNVAGEVGLKLVVLDVIGDGGSDAFARRMAFYRPPRFPELSGSPGADVHRHRHDPGHVRRRIACRGGLRRKGRDGLRDDRRREETSPGLPSGQAVVIDERAGLA